MASKDVFFETVQLGYGIGYRFGFRDGYSRGCRDGYRVGFKAGLGNFLKDAVIIADDISNIVSNTAKILSFFV